MAFQEDIDWAIKFLIDWMSLKKHKTKNKKKYKWNLKVKKKNDNKYQVLVRLWGRDNPYAQLVRM